LAVIVRDPETKQRSADSRATLARLLFIDLFFLPDNLVAVGSAVACCG